MNFRAKIWMLPASAGVIFVVGLVIGLLIASHGSRELEALRSVDNPHLERLLRVAHGINQFRDFLKSAVVEGDAEKLNKAESVMLSVREELRAAEKLAGKAQIVAALRTDFEAYQSAALVATRAMMQAANFERPLQDMQAAQKTLDARISSEEQVARTALEARFGAVASIQRMGLLASLLTAVLVVLALGMASYFIISSVWSDLGGEPAHLRELAQRVAQGDLDAQTEAGAGDDHSLKAAMQLMVVRLRDTVTAIHATAAAISTASREIASGSGDLRSRTDRAAASLQTTTGEMQQLTSTVQESAGSADQARQLAESAADCARRGSEIVTHVVSNMHDITTASHRVAEISTVIDGIAFQTNLLSLNAAVEAARAGSQGRGFAVVAAEVRALAQRSASAANEIKALIGAARDKVDDGSKFVNDAGQAMEEILSSAQRVTRIVHEITSATAAQTSGIGQVNRAVADLESLTQQNAQLVEKSAAAAGDLEQQARALMDAVETFHIDALDRQARSVGVLA